MTNNSGPLHRLNTRIGIKLTLFLTCVILLSALALIFVSRHLVTQFGELAADLNETGIRRQAYHFLNKITQEQSGRYGSFFMQSAAFTSLAAEQAAVYLSPEGRYSDVGDSDDSLRFHSEKGMFTNSSQAMVSVIYWDRKQLTDDIRRQLKALSHIDPLLEKIQKSSYSAVASWILLKNSITRYYPNTPLVDFLPPTSQYDCREDRYYQAAVPENNPERKTLWTEVYRDPGGQGLMTTAATPIYSNTGDFLGVAGIDITLDRIVHTILNEPAASQNPAVGEWSHDFSFLIDNAGRIIGFPEKHLHRFGLPDRNTDDGTPSASLASLSDSAYPAVRELADKMVSGKTGLDEVMLGNGRYFIAYHPMPSTGWRLGVVAAEKDILSSVTETRDAIRATVRRLTSFLTFITTALLLASIIISTNYIMKKMVNPLRRLSDASIQVEQGRFDTHVEIETQDEIGFLAAAFNRMVDRLKDSYEQLADYNRTLESRVTERTAELARKSREQEETLELLKKNIEERREVEIRLRESEERYRDIFQNSIEGIFQSTADDRIIRANPSLARLLGYSSVEEFLSSVQNIARQLYVHPEKRQQFVRDLEEKRTVSGFETRLHRKDGSIIWVSISARAVEETDGSILYIQGSMKDISKRRQAEKMIRKARRMAENANRAKSDFIATISHEIRTPLNAIIGMTELALQTGLNDKQSHYLATVREASEHLLSLFNNILDYSKIEAGKLKLESAPFNIKRLVDHSLGMVSFPARKKNLRITADIDPEVPAYLYGDARRLSQILLNLLGNAVKFTENGTVSVHVSNESVQDVILVKKAALLFSVTDTGIGIAPENLETVFTSFVQLDDIDTRQSGGTGLGLAISKELVGLMGGKIWAESELGNGSRFCFRLALKIADAGDIQLLQKQEAHLLNPAEKSLLPPHLKVLLAEDFVVNEEIILGILEKHGCRITVVCNGLDAVKAVRQHYFDVVLMDIRMPVMDGLTAAKKIRNLKDPKAAAVPIIALTAHVVKDDREYFLAAGMNDYLAKPFRSHDLLRVIRNVISLPSDDIPAGPAENSTESISAPASGSGKIVDLEYALQLMDDDPRVLKIACRSMVKNIPQKLAELESAVEAKDIRRAHRLAHSLKSAAKSVGAFRVADIAYEVELACSHRRGADIAGKLPVLRKQMEGMLEQLELYIES